MFQWIFLEVFFADQVHEVFRVDVDGRIFVWHVNGVYGYNEYYMKTSPYISIYLEVKYVGDMGIKWWYLDAER